MEYDYRNIISHIDVDRGIGSIEFFNFAGMDDLRIAEFKSDIGYGNDQIELHLIKSKSYKEALILKLKRSNGAYADVWRDLLKDEQKTFGGSKIFYVSDNCDMLLVLALPNEMSNKLNMVINRLNKINEKITRLNLKIKKDNLDVYAVRIKSKEDLLKKKDEIINFINQNLRV